MKVIHLGRADYVPTWRAMQAFAARPFGMEGEELWLCEHPPVFTLGMAGRPEHVLAAGGIDVVQTDRGGQATYHGPGQVVAYPLINLGERSYFVKEYVHRLEEAVIRTLPGTPAPQPDFTGLAKISALGIKVSRQHAYHGVALNVDMALEPFERINPCGHAGLPAIDLSSIGVRASWDEAASALAAHLTRLLAP